MTNFEHFITRNENLIHQIAHRYSVKLHTHEDLYQEGCMKLFDVFDKYDDNYSETTFISSVLPNFYYNMVKASNTKEKQNQTDSGQRLKDIKNFNFDVLPYNNNLYNTIYKEQVLEKINKLLEEEYYKEGFIELLYGKTYDEVASQYGVSRQNINQRFQTFLEKVRNEIYIDKELLYNILDKE